MKTKIKDAPKPAENLTGREFDRWKVDSYAGYEKRHLWNVTCTCGNKSVVGEYQLKNGLSRSCGCLAREINTSHGESQRGNRSPEYRAFELAKNQCRNPRHENYEKFGALGVEFRFESFEEFLEEVGRKPGPKYVLTRKNNQGNYESGNIEWTRNKNRIRN